MDDEMQIQGSVSVDEEWREGRDSVRQLAEVVMRLTDGATLNARGAKLLAQAVLAQPLSVPSVRENTVAHVWNGEIMVPTYLFRDGDKVEVMVTPWKDEN